MKRSIFFLLLFLGFSVFSADWLFCDFSSGPMEKIQVQGKGRFSGVLPKNVYENFVHWKLADCRTVRRRDSDGTSYTRFLCTKDSSQFFLRLGKFPPGAFCRLTAVIRNNLDGPASFSFRQINAPYQSLGKGALDVRQNEPYAYDWDTVSAVFQLPKTKERDAGLFFYFNGCGELDLRSLKLETISSAEYEKFKDNGKLRLQAFRPSAESVNYLRNSRLPVGLQTGWAVVFSHLSDTGVVECAPAVPGPSGIPALRIRKTLHDWYSVMLSSEMFSVPETGKKYTFSFSYKGKGRAKVSMIFFPEAAPVVKYLESSDSWKRESIDFAVPKECVAIQATWEVLSPGGEFFLDAFRAAPFGNRDYRAAGACEIAFSLPESDASSARIQFTDEPPHVQWCVTGNAVKGAVIRWKITDIYGNEKSPPATDLSATTSNGVLKYDLFPEAPLGQFRIEAQVFQKDRALSPVNEFIVTRIPRPVFWGKDAPDSPFGIHVQPQENMLAAVKAAGMNHVRLHDADTQRIVNWFYLEPVKGKWNFRDDLVDLYRRWHLLLYGQFAGAPVWASRQKFEKKRCSNFYFQAYQSPLSLAEWERYVSTLAGHYQGKISKWFVWNEPWLFTFFNKNWKDGKAIPFENPAEEYMKLLKSAYTTIKRQYPEMTVTGFNSNSNSEWTEQVYRLGAYHFCDEMDFHFYSRLLRGFPGDSIREMIRDVFGIVFQKETAPVKPIYMTEGTAGNASVAKIVPLYGIAKHSLTYAGVESFHARADGNMRYMMALLAGGISRIFLYTTALSAYAPLNCHNLLLLTGADGYPHPMLVACSAFTRRMEKKRFRFYRELAPDVFAALFSDGSSSTAVITGKRKKATIRCSIPDAVAVDLYGNPRPFPLHYSGFLMYVDCNGDAETLANALAADESM